jgi:hypothetical protein
MVRVSGYWTRPPAHLKIEGDLDMGGYAIKNAVLGPGIKLGGDLDGRGHSIKNVVLVDAVLGSDLDARGFKIKNIGIDEADPSSVVNMAALLDAIYPSVEYERYLCWDTERPPPLMISGYLSGPRRIIGTKPDPGILYRTYAVETVNKIVYYNDLRHSHDLDTQDTTEYTVSGTTLTEVLRYDYGAVINAKEVYFIVSARVTGGIGTVLIESSEDGSTWQEVWKTTVITGSEVFHKILRYDLTFRYLRMRLVNSGQTATIARLRKIIITT